MIKDDSFDGTLPSRMPYSWQLRTESAPPMLTEENRNLKAQSTPTILQVCDAQKSPTAQLQWSDKELEALLSGKLVNTEEVSVVPVSGTPASETLPPIARNADSERGSKLSTLDTWENLIRYLQRADPEFDIEDSLPDGA